MQADNLKSFVNGWFIGNFDPSIYPVDYEVGLHRHVKGTTHKKHYHKIATEINLIVSGRCIFDFGKEKGKFILESDDIILVEPGESVEFKALTDCTIVVVKTKSVSGDKYFT